MWAGDLAASAERPTGLTCVGCGGAMSLRAGEHRRAHFAHRPGATCVAGETALHAMAIRAIADGLVHQSHQGRPYPMAIKCDHCDVGRMADLAREPGLSVDVDRAVAPEARPDILVRSGAGDTLFVVEVIVTHAPEESALEAFKRLGLRVIAVRPTWDALEGLREGLDALEAVDGAPKPGSTGLLSECRLPRHLADEAEHLRPCGECGADARVLTLEVAETRCYRCSGRARVLDVHLREDGRRVAVAAGAVELRGVAAVAREMNVRLEKRNSKAAGTSYLANVCQCGALLGDNFIYEGFSSTESYETDLTTPVRHYEVCRAGHWRLLAERRWPPESTAWRDLGARGLCGDRAGVFEEAKPLVSVTAFDNSADAARAIAHFMTWGRRW